jgi:hypothetical protein
VTENVSSDTLVNVSTTLVVTDTIDCNVFSNVSSITGTFSLNLPITTDSCGILNMSTTNTAALWGFGHSQGPNYYTHPLPGSEITWNGLIFGVDSDAPAHTSSEINIFANSSLQTSRTITGHTSGIALFYEFNTPFTTNTGQQIEIFGRRLNGVDGSEAVVIMFGNYQI